LAERTGISVSTLSRLESGLRRPTLELLLLLAREHGVPLDELVGAPEVGDPRIHPRPVRRNGTTWIPFTRNPGGINAYKQIIPVVAGSPSALELHSHAGYEWIYVLSGSIRLALGTEYYELKAGEAAEFDTVTPHAIANSGSRVAELLIIFGLNGEKVHMRATSTPSH
jgi:mannose-6-phosphate isomerase-like protein (cupin superfamily)